MPRPRPYSIMNILGNPHERLPPWGKLSPQVTDEGATAGHIPLIRRVPRHLPPQGEGFFGGNDITGKPRLWLPPLGEAVTAGEPDISPSSGAYRATFPPRGRLFRQKPHFSAKTVFVYCNLPRPYTIIIVYSKICAVTARFTKEDGVELCP